MATAYLSYDELLQDALRAVVREAIAQVAARGMLGNHHFFVTFRTSHPGVEIPDYLRAQYPDEMTIVLQHQYSGLEVTPEGFSVTLSFNKIPERLTVPWAALTRFADPPANFGLQLAPTAAGEVTAAAEAKPAPAAEPGTAKKAAEDPSAKVVALDAFRKS
jgi:hypothetical protein